MSSPKPCSNVRSGSCSLGCSWWPLGCGACFLAYEPGMSTGLPHGRASDQRSKWITVSLHMQTMHVLM